MSCIHAKLSHFSNISTILALDGANSVMSSAYNYKYTIMMISNYTVNTFNDIIIYFCEIIHMMVYTNPY